MSDAEDRGNSEAAPLAVDQAKVVSIRFTSGAAAHEWLATARNNHVRSAIEDIEDPALREREAVVVGAQFDKALARG